MTRKKKFPIFLTAMLLLTTLTQLTLIETSAQQEMTPEWTYENGDRFSIVTVSTDGNYIGVGTKNTNRFYLFRRNLLLWNYSVGNISSISMSSDGKYIAIGTESNFYLFDRDNSLPLLSYGIDYETSVVAISSDGKYAVVGAMPSTYFQNAESKLYMFEREQSTPTWTKTLPGILESLSISNNGSYIVASTSLPGIMYVFAREWEIPLWHYSFGNWSGGVKISGTGDFIVATGGDQVFANDPTRERRIFQFARQSSTPIYQKSIPELPSRRGLAVSSNGSIFAVSYSNRSEFMLFNMNIQPYGPNSIRTASLPACRVSMTMSSDGRYTFFGTVKGVYVCEYWDNQLIVKRQYTMNDPFIYDIASSSDGRHLVAVGYLGSSDNEPSFIYFFDTFSEKVTIYIKPDGTVYPLTAPIECNLDVYTFTANIFGSVVVQRNNTVVDGGGYSLEGDDTGKGFDLSNTRNVTVKNTKISKFSTGISLSYSTGATLVNNNITKCVYGILPFNSPSCTISNNVIESNYWDGIFLTYSDNNILDNNIIANHSKWGLYLGSSTGIILRNNQIVGNRWNFGVSVEFVHDIDASNTIDGKPIYYLVNQRDKQIPANAGYVAVINSTNITMRNLNLTNNGQGVVLVNSRNCLIENSTITKMGYYGIQLVDSDNNVISGNNITDNRPPYFGVGIAVQTDSTGNIISNNIIQNNEHGILFYISSANVIYHNDFVGNTAQALIEGSTNVWDNGYPSGGNYWSDYTGVDADGDGIGDIPYTIYANNRDRYPLMTPYIIPEFPLILLLSLFMVATLLAVTIYKRKHTI